MATPRLKTAIERWKYRMDFLKDVLGEELYKQVGEKIDSYNRENTEHTIKLGNLSSGDYIGKGKFESLQAEFNSKAEELKNANSLIDQLKAGDQSEALKSKIAEYEGTVQKLQNTLLNEKKSNALKFALASANTKDIDYMSFKVREKGDFELDDNGKIKGWEETLKSLKSEFPTQFETQSSKKVNEKKINTDGETGKITREDFNKMSYAQRVKLYNEDKETYEKLTAKK